MAAGKDKLGRPLVVVTGLGVVTSLGAGKADNWAKLTAGESGIKTITRFPTDGLKTRIAGTIDYLPPQACAAALTNHSLNSPPGRPSHNPSSARPANFRVPSSWRCRPSSWIGRNGSRSVPGQAPTPRSPITTCGA